MRIVADTNTFLAVALGEPEREAILKATGDCDLVAPDVLPFEIGNALTAMLRRGRLEPGEVLTAWDVVQRIPVELRRTDVRSALTIAIQHGLFAYDAYFLECAMRLRCPLLTLDQRLRATALVSGVGIVEGTDA